KCILFRRLEHLTLSQRCCSPRRLKHHVHGEDLLCSGKFQLPHQLVAVVGGETEKILQPSHFASRKGRQFRQLTLIRPTPLPTRQLFLQLFELVCGRQRIPVRSRVVDREHHHDVLQPIWFRLDDYRDTRKAKLDRASPAPFSIQQDVVVLCVLVDG